MSDTNPGAGAARPGKLEARPQRPQHSTHDSSVGPAWQLPVHALCVLMDTLPHTPDCTLSDHVPSVPSPYPPTHGLPNLGSEFSETLQPCYGSSTVEITDAGMAHRGGTSMQALAQVLLSQVVWDSAVTCTPHSLARREAQLFFLLLRALLILLQGMRHNFFILLSRALLILLQGMKHDFFILLLRVLLILLQGMKALFIVLQGMILMLRALLFLLLRVLLILCKAWSTTFLFCCYVHSSFSARHGAQL